MTFDRNPDPFGALVPGDLAYEEAFEALGQVLERLDDVRLPLSEAVALYERGRALAAHCTALLDAAELRMETAE